MKRSIKLLSIIICAVMIMTLASCASGGTNQSVKGGNAVTDTSKPTKDGGKTTVTFTHWGSPFEKDCLNTASREYEKLYPNITVNNIYIPADYTTKIATMLASNKAPDCGFVGTTDLYAWGAEGRFVNIYELIDADLNLKREDFLDGVFVESDPGKVSYGWFIASEPRAVFYNKTMFDEAKISYLPSVKDKPLKWDEFVQVCQKLTLDSKKRNALDPNFDVKSIVQYGVSVGGTAMDKYLSLIFNAGADIISEDGKKFILDSPEGILALKNIQDLIFKYHVMPNPADLKNMPSGVVALASKQVAILVDGHWNLLDLGQLDLEYDVAVPPVMGNMTSSVITNDCAPISVFKGPHEKEGYEFLKYLANPENSLTPFKNGLWFPILKSALEPAVMSKWMVGKAHPAGFQSVFVDQLLNGKVIKPFYNYVREKTPEITTLLDTKFEAIFVEGQDVEKVLKEQIRPEMEKILSK